MTPPLIAYELLCAALFYTVFCRLVRSNNQTRRLVRLAFLVLGTVSAMGMAAPLAWGLHPDWMTVALLASFLLVQVVTAIYWQDGVPITFRRGGML